MARPGLVEPALEEPTDDAPEDRLAPEAAEPVELAPPLDPPPAEPPLVCANAGAAAIANARPATPKCFARARMELPPLMSDFISNANG
jgi:hypothetical protein